MKRRNERTIVAELKKKFSSPREALAALGLDEALLDEANLAFDGARKMKSTRFGALVLQLTAAHLAPCLALDKKLELSTADFKGLTRKNFAEKRKPLLEKIKLATDGKLKKGMAFDKTVIDALFSNIEEGAANEKADDESESEAQHNAMEAAAHGESTLNIPKEVGEEFSEADKGKSFDSGPLMSFLKSKGMSEDDLGQVGSMLPKENALDEEDPEAKKKAEEEAAAKKKAEDEKMKDMVPKAAMDAALKAQGEQFDKKITAATKLALDTAQGIRVAMAEVEPWIGVVPATLAFDSAEAVHRHALKVIGVEGHATLHKDALLPVLKAQPKPGAKPARPQIAQDSAPKGDGTSFAERFPNAAQVRQAAA